MSTTETTPTPTCPECGSQLEATTMVYWSYVSGRRVVTDTDNESFSITCANDHAAEGLLPAGSVSDLHDELSTAAVALGRFDGPVLDFSATAIRVHLGGDEETGWLVAACSDEELAEAARRFLDGGRSEPWDAFHSWVCRIAEDADAIHQRRLSDETGGER